jgi:hypothetical protein
MKNNKQKLYEEFLNGSNNSDMQNKMNLFHWDKIKEKISNDLVNSKLRLSILYLFFSTIGYLVTLSLCAQGFVGLTAFSHSNLVVLQTIFSPMICSIVCGAIFTAIPFLFSLFLLNRFKRRFLFLKMSWLVIAIPIISTTAIFLLHSYHEALITMHSHINEAIIWALAAILTPYILYFFTYIIIRQRRV